MADCFNSVASVVASNKTGEHRAADQSGHGLARVKRNLGLALRPIQDIVSYDPKPLNKPVVEDDLEERGLLLGSAETIRYNLACLEYRLSPRGHLRAYVWLNLRLLLLFVIPATVSLVALGVAAPIFGHVAAILGFVENGARSLMMGTIYIAFTVAIVGVIGLVLAAFMSRRRRGDR